MRLWGTIRFAKEEPRVKSCLKKRGDCSYEVLGDVSRLTEARLDTLEPHPISVSG